MAQPGSHDLLRPTVLDRLIAKDSDSSFKGVTVRELKASVARDLEWLLNTRCWSPWETAHLEEVSDSLLAFGLPDLSTYSWAEEGNRKSVAGLIKDCIRRFEKRLDPNSLLCTVQAPRDSADFELRVRIEARIDVDPINEPVVFDSGLDIAAGSLTIENVS